MTEHDFRRMVARLERECDIAPGRYRVRVLLLAALAYAYVALLLLLALGALGWGANLLASGHSLFAGAKLALVGLVASALMMRALWVRLDAPTGRPLTAREAPQLYRLIAKLRAREKGPQIHQVLISEEFNASIVQTPRFGILGGYRNTLIVGLPLLQALSPKEFAAVVAHEYGHIHGAHGKVSAWVYRTRRIWQRLLDSFGDEQGGFDRLLTGFFRWFVPKFSAYSFVLARQQEYEADQAAARLVGAEVAAQALVAASVKGRFIGEKFWPGLFAQADRQPRPGFLPHATLRTAFRLGATGEDYERWLKESLAQRTGVNDTHPSLRDRLDALDQRAAPPRHAEPSAAAYFLGNSLAALVDSFDRAWLAAVEPQWQSRYRAVCDAEACIALAARAEPARMEPEQLGPYALALHTLGRDQEALPWLRQVAEHSRGSAQCALIAGQLLIDAGNAEAIRYLEIAMDRDGELIHEATWRAWKFFDDLGDEAQANYWADRLAKVEAD